MPPNATEIGILPLKSGVDISSGEAKEIWDKTIETVKSQPGFISFYWGLQVENPANLQFMIEWVSLQEHQKFMDSPPYKPFLERLGSILGGPTDIYHVHFPATLSEVTRAPVLECASFYLPSEQAEGFKPILRQFLTTLDGQNGYINTVDSQAVEMAEHDSLKDHGGKGARFLLIIGWTSVDKHMEFRGTDKFKNNIHLLRENISGSEMHHLTLAKA